MTQADEQVVVGVCPHDCPDTCAWEVTVQDGLAIKLVGTKDHPFTRGGLCAKVNHYLERAYSPERILHPLRRVGPKGSTKFERVTWDEGLDAVASALKSVVRDFGPSAVLPYSYMGTQGLIQGSSIDRRFFARHGATRLERNICGSAGGQGITAAIGTSTGILPEDVIHSRFIILWGTNTVVTNLHLWPFILQAKKRGARVVVIDPRRSRTAAKADIHLRPYPGTDAALALGMMNVIVGMDLHDREYLAKHTVGHEQLLDRIDEYPPERAAEVCGLRIEEIVELASAYATNRPSLIRTLVGMEHHSNGAMMLRTIACLPAIVGSWRDLGGGLLHMTASPFFQALDTAVVGMPELVDNEIRSVNMVQLGKALTGKGMQPPIKLLVVYNSNPAAIAPHQNLVFQGLMREDLTTVVLEQFMTDTAIHADFIFPATTQIEHYDLHWAWGHTYISLNKPAITPMGESQPNTEFFRRLAERVGFEETYLQDSDLDLIQAALNSEHPYLAGVTFERLMEEGWAPLNLPQPWVPFAEGNFPTASGKCQLISDDLESEKFDRLPSHNPAAESLMGDPELIAQYPLQLITPKSALHFLNSSYANLPRHLKAEGQPRLEIHPEDATPRGIRDGQRVRVFNNRGEVEIRATVGDQVRPSVVSMPSGWWASHHSGGSSANALTPDGLSDLGGGGDFHDTLVEVEPVR